MDSKVVLCIEDNVQVQMINKPLLMAKGFEVKLAMTLREARKALEVMPDLIILDIHLPDGNGLDFLRELRKTSNVPVIALTNSKEEQDMVEGLASGCDDYIPKPYTFSVLYARIEALMRRAEYIPEKIVKGAFIFDMISNSVTWNGDDLGIRKKEFDVLYFFMRNENTVLSEAQIYERVWNQKMIGDKKALKNAIYDLRESLNGTGYVISSEYGKGYIFHREV